MPLTSQGQSPTEERTKGLLDLGRENVQLGRGCILLRGRRLHEVVPGEERALLGPGGWGRSRRSSACRECVRLAILTPMTSKVTSMHDVIGQQAKHTSAVPHLLRARERWGRG